VQHRAALKSVSHAQLSGENISLSTAISECPSGAKNKDLEKTISINGKNLDPEAPAYPCGIYASLFPKDDFTLKQKITTSSGTIEIDIPISTTGIAWANQKEKYTLQNNGDTSWIDPQSGKFQLTIERFIEWMRAPLRSTFYKLWGKIYQDLEPGLYQIYINNGKLSFNFRYFAKFFTNREVYHFTECRLDARSQ
jgi:LEM3 (ligand-effect modulator 3) family / CDC50 family